MLACTSVSPSCLVFIHAPSPVSLLRCADDAPVCAGPQYDETVSADAADLAAKYGGLWLYIVRCRTAHMSAEERRQRQRRREEGIGGGVELRDGRLRDGKQPHPLLIATVRGWSSVTLWECTHCGEMGLRRGGAHGTERCTINCCGLASGCRQGHWGGPKADALLLRFLPYYTRCT